jgi:hypothetical protein
VSCQISGCLTDCWEFVSGHANHAQLANLASSPQVKQREANNANFLVGPGSLAIDESGCIFTSSDLGGSVSSSFCDWRSNQLTMSTLRGPWLAAASVLTERSDIFEYGIEICGGLANDPANNQRTDAEGNGAEFCERYEALSR